MFQNPAQTATVSHMGGEGAMWLGQQPFTTEKHVFANMGDGTYFHSGFLAIRQAVAAKVPITYKLLVNGFVSMTGGQRVDGDLTLPRMVARAGGRGRARDRGRHRRPGAHPRARRCRPASRSITAPSSKRCSGGCASIRTSR